MQREILRVVAKIYQTDENGVLSPACHEVLRWAQNRAGDKLPHEAWEGLPFEILVAGRTTMAVSVENATGIVWSLRGDDPDKNVPGRIWSTEVSLSRAHGTDSINLGVRLLANSGETELSIEPATPGLVRQLSSRFKMMDGPVRIRSVPYFLKTDHDISSLIGWLMSDTRRLPVVAASGDERSSDSDRPLIDLHSLARALCGLAHIIFVPASLTYYLSDVLGKSLSVFHGGIRIYRPSHDIFADPRDHQLYTSSAIDLNPINFLSEIRSGIARESIRRTRLGHDVEAFLTVRNIALQVQQARQIAHGASDSEQLVAATARNELLELEIKSLRASADQAFELSVDEENRAKDAEKQLTSAWAKIEQLEFALKSLSPAGSADVLADPSSWDDFAGWCDDALSGHLSLAPAARRSVRKPAFEDLKLAISCVRWLASEARDRFLNGGGSLTNIPVFDAVTNAPCGADECYFEFQGRRLIANWHLKNGGNTRQPERCLRIYYSFDQISRQIIISDMPAHRETGAT